MIQTDRLDLRPLGLADIDSFVDLHAEAWVTRFVDPYPRDRALARLAEVERQWTERGYGLFAAVCRDSGAFIGRCGLNYWEQFDEVEAAWTLHPTAWGRGYATEAARACVDWGFEMFGFPRITAMIRHGNTASVRGAERLGFSPRREEIVAGHPVTVYVGDRI
ncbi:MULTISPECIES: GNAT family N-acetyltransferase [Kitasatospora]|uniref:GNAT family N-acetyltransferase n=1 Tax=Kitasatospora TaxID=2063 RepID=UPI0031CDFD73